MSLFISKFVRVLWQKMHRDSRLPIMCQKAMPFPFFCRLISLPHCQFQHNCSYITDSLLKERPLVGLLRGASCSISSVFVSRKLPQLWPKQRKEQCSSLNKIYSNAFNPQMSWRFVCTLKKKLSFDNILIVGMKF